MAHLGLAKQNKMSFVAAVGHPGCPATSNQSTNHGQLGTQLHQRDRILDITVHRSASAFPEPRAHLDGCLKAEIVVAVADVFAFLYVVALMENASESGQAVRTGMPCATITVRASM